MILSASWNVGDRADTATGLARTWVEGLVTFPCATNLLPLVTKTAHLEGFGTLEMADTRTSPHHGKNSEEDPNS
jgi:hypothetical protein